MPLLESAQSVAELVLDHPACARVFQRHRIDFSFDGEQTIAEAAAAQDLDLRALVVELEDAVERSRISADHDWRALDAPALVDRLAREVHRELRKTLAYVAALSARVAASHGDRNHRLRLLDETIVRVAAELEAHMWGEETSLFPAIRDGGRDRAAIETALLGMHDEHLFVNGLLSRLRADADDFRVPRWAGSDYRTLFSELEMLEHDVLRHVHLENHLLLPRCAS